MEFVVLDINVAFLYCRRRSRDRSAEKSSRRRSRSRDRSRSPNRRSRSDHSTSKKEETFGTTNSRLMEMSMNSSSRLNADINEPTKKLSIKDRLGPIRAPSGGRSTNSRKSPSRKDKWLVENKLCNVSLLKTRVLYQNICSVT